LDFPAKGRAHREGVFFVECRSDAATAKRAVSSAKRQAVGQLLGLGQVHLKDSLHFDLVGRQAMWAGGCRIPNGSMRNAGV
jgi:hypothetical protein